MCQFCQREKALNTLNVLSVFPAYVSIITDSAFFGSVLRADIGISRAYHRARHTVHALNRSVQNTEKGDI